MPFSLLDFEMNVTYDGTNFTYPTQLMLNGRTRKEGREKKEGKGRKGKWDGQE